MEDEERFEDKSKVIYLGDCKMPFQIRFWSNFWVRVLGVICSFGAAGYIGWVAWTNDEWYIQGLCALLVLLNVFAGAKVAIHLFGEKKRCVTTGRSDNN